jgi:hypothetical protein
MDPTALIIGIAAIIIALVVYWLQRRDVFSVYQRSRDDTLADQRRAARRSLGEHLTRWHDELIGAISADAENLHQGRLGPQEIRSQRDRLETFIRQQDFEGNLILIQRDLEHFVGCDAVIDAANAFRDAALDAKGDVLMAIRQTLQDFSQKPLLTRDDADELKRQKVAALERISRAFDAAMAAIAEARSGRLR